MADKITVEAVDAALAGWQQGAGSDWQDVLRKRRELCRTEYEGAGQSREMPPDPVSCKQDGDRLPSLRHCSGQLPTAIV